MIIDGLTFLPTYDDTLEQNAEYLRQILPLMSKHKIATDPLNFAIFYEYIIGRNIGLNNELDALLGKQVVFTSELSAKLFKKIYLRHFDRFPGKNKSPPVAAY